MENQSKIEDTKKLIENYVPTHKRRFRPMNPNKNYDRETFVKSFDNHQKLEDYLKRLNENHDDPKTMRKLGYLLAGSGDYFEQFDNPSEHAMVEGERAHTHSTENTARHVHRNLDDFLDIYDDDELMTLASSVPLYKLDSNDAESEEHNKYVELTNEIRMIHKISEDKDIDAMAKYVSKKISKEPEWYQESFNYFGNRRDNIVALFSTYAQDAEVELISASRTREGKINANKLRNVLKDGLKQAWKEHSKESNLGDKEDIWEDAIRPVYMEVARGIFKKEKARTKRDKNPAREARKAERRRLGIPA